MAERDHNGGPSYWFPVWNGIFDHREKIGPAIWVFLWCIDRVTKEESGVGLVLRGSVVTAEKIASELQDSEHTIRRHLRRLAGLGYIGLKLSAHGFIITVLNSRKFDLLRSAKNGRPGIPIGRPKMYEGRPEVADLGDKNGRPHKEKVFDVAVDSTKTKQCDRCKGTGLTELPAQPGRWVRCFVCQESA